MGHALKDAYNEMKKTGIVVFRDESYILEDMTPEELSTLNDELRQSSKELRRPLRELTNEENRQRGFLSRLRLMQSKLIRREARKQEIEL
jgi:hypothetical protein